MNTTPVTEQELVAAAVAPRVTQDHVDASIEKSDFLYHGQLTICVLTLKNGFTVTGENACASPANYNKEIGDRLAFNDARNKIWGLLGFLLKEQLHVAAQPAKADDTDWTERLRVEALELNDKLVKLRRFLEGKAFTMLPAKEQALLVEQEKVMAHYHIILMSRLAH